MARLHLRRTLSGFVPSDEESQELARKFKVGDVYRADVIKPRSYKHHKLFFSLITLTYQNLPEKFEGQWPTMDAFRYAVAEAAGYKEEYTSVDGEVRVRAKSISYAALPDQVEFQRVFGAMMTVCARILDMGEPELAAEVSRYCDASY
jgi:Protein of unknown function (DUF1367)